VWSVTNIFRPHKPHRRFLKRPISIHIFGDDLLALDGRSFLLNSSGFLHGDAVQEHSAGDALGVRLAWPAGFIKGGYDSKTGNPLSFGMKRVSILLLG
jgi:hypothetical protein